MTPEEILAKLQPENNHVLVKPIDETIQKVGSIYTVQSATSRNRALSAEVIKICLNSNLKPGDILFFNTGAVGTHIPLAIGDFKIMREQDVLVRLKKEDQKEEVKENGKPSKSFKYELKEKSV